MLVNDLLEGIKELIDKIPNVMIYPEWMFFHRNSIKVLHYSPFMVVEEAKPHTLAFDKEEEPGGV